MRQSDSTSDDHREMKYYLPGTPTASTRIEKFVKRVFRRRGRIRADRHSERTNR